MRRPCGTVALFALASVLAAAPRPAAAQDSTAKSAPWERLQFLVGTWTGVGHGEPGTSSVEREYAFALRGRFLEVRNRSTYRPQAKNPRGEVHEDRGFIGWDRARRRFVYRQFHVEGFVNQYVADSLGAPADSIVFRSEAIENIPAGYRARETCRRLGADEFVERFEIAEPDSGFAVYTETRFTRRK